MSNPTVTAEQLKAALVAEVEHFDMSDWMGGAIRIEPGPLNCGTTLCLAGLACHIAGDTMGVTESGFPYVEIGEEHISIAKRAMELLGLEDDRMFYTTYWPTVLQEEYENVRYFNSPKEAAKVALKVIDCYMGGKNE
jgi:hypothetical protein